MNFKSLFWEIPDATLRSVLFVLSVVSTDDFPVRREWTEWFLDVRLKFFLGIVFLCGALDEHKCKKIGECVYRFGRFFSAMFARKSLDHNVIFRKWNQTLVWILHYFRRGEPSVGGVRLLEEQHDCAKKGLHLSNGVIVGLEGLLVPLVKRGVNAGLELSRRDDWRNVHKKKNHLECWRKKEKKK